ncbi:MAG: Fic family protein [Candidatus Heimdallarchaeota archaeon]|nr:Fic family protein [Candidatus Heimdallarchaeota archaeon]
MIQIHNLSIKRFGGEKGLLHKDQLLSFDDMMIQALYFGEKNIIEMAAWIFVLIVQNHYFIDGNKRTGLSVMLNFLKSNNCYWNLKKKNHFYLLTLKIASNTEEDILEEVEIDLKKVIICKK